MNDHTHTVNHTHGFNYDLPGVPDLPRIDHVALEVANRKDEKEAARVKAAFEAFDALNLDDEDYRIWVWTHSFEGDDRDFNYVALYTHERWYVTGRKGPNGIDTDEFIGWCVRQGFDPQTFACLA